MSGSPWEEWVWAWPGGGLGRAVVRLDEARVPASDAPLGFLESGFFGGAFLRCEAQPAAVLGLFDGGDQRGDRGGQLGGRRTNVSPQCGPLPRCAVIGPTAR